MFYREFYRGGLEGVVNGLLMRFMGIFGYQIVYGTKSYPAEYPVCSPSKPLRGRTIHRNRAGCRGYSVVPLLFLSQSTVVL